MNKSPDTVFHHVIHVISFHPGQRMVQCPGSSTSLGFLRQALGLTPLPGPMSAAQGRAGTGAVAQLLLSSLMTVC